MLSFDRKAWIVGLLLLLLSGFLVLVVLDPTDATLLRFVETVLRFVFFVLLVALGVLFALAVTAKVRIFSHSLSYRWINTLVALIAIFVYATVNRYQFRHSDADKARVVVLDQWTNQIFECRFTKKCSAIRIDYKYEFYEFKYPEQQTTRTDNSLKKLPEDYSDWEVVDEPKDKIQPPSKTKK
mgnify:CR=1 FL=1